MGILDDIINADVAQVFTNPDDFGEEITYLPHASSDDGHPSHAFNATVIRDPLEVLKYLPRGKVAPKMVVIVPRSDDPDVGRSSINPQVDRIRVAYRKDKPADTGPHTVMEILNQDGGWTLAVN